MRSRSVRPWTVAFAIPVGVAFALLWGWALATQSYNVWGSMVWVPIVVAINAFLVWGVGRRSQDRWLTRLLAIALAAKLLGTLGWYYVAYVVYGGASDAERYNVYAAYRYASWRQGRMDWGLDAKQGTEVVVTSDDETVLDRIAGMVATDLDAE